MARLEATRTRSRSAANRPAVRGRLALLAFAESRKLMRRAIVESPPGQTQSVDRAREVAKRFLSHVGVPDGDVTKLRELPVSAILEAQRTLLAQAVASGDFSEQFNIVDAERRLAKGTG